MTNSIPAKFAEEVIRRAKDIKRAGAQGVDDNLDPCKWLDDAPEKAKGWRNLWFDKTGKARLGNTICASEQEAREVAENALAQIGIYHFIKTDEYVHFQEISHAIQMPVKE